jgi:hypothetical protein
VAKEAAPFNDTDYPVDLPDYDPLLTQRLGSEQWAVAILPVVRARVRAAAIAALLDVSSTRELQAALVWLEDFFQRRPAGATFGALERAALEGLDFPTLRAMDELRQAWEERPEYWVTRVRSSPASGHSTATMRLANGGTALSWVDARRICRARCDLPPDHMIDPEWLSEWLTSHPGARSAISFAQYVADKVVHFAAQDIDTGLCARARAEDPTEWFDQLGASRKILDPREGRPVSVRMVDVVGPRKKKDDDNE